MTIRQHVVFPLTVFVVSRAGLFLLAYLSLAMLPVNNAPDVWRRAPFELALDGWARWDSAWYADVARTGYTNLPRGAAGLRDTAFFPLYPLVIRAGAALLWKNPFVAGILLSNVAFLAALIVLFRLASMHHGSDVARRTVVMLAVFPFSFFFAAMYSEALFLLAVVSAFYFGERRQWLAAGLAAAAASATRIFGVFVVLGLALLYLEHIDWDRRRIRPDALWVLLGLLGLGGYMFFLGIRFGEPLAFLRSQYAWLDADPELTWSKLPVPGSLAAWLAGNYRVMDSIQLCVTLGVLLVAPLTWRRLPLAYAVWTMVMLVGSLRSYLGMGRFAAVIFPLFIVSALLLHHERSFQVVMYLSTLLLALFTIMFSHCFYVA